MARYHLDDLGWLQFENLMQSLLKVDCGLGIESWGRSGDFGCDAYAEYPMNFPSKELNNGPFIFQAKFIQYANSVGAKYWEPLLGSIRKEIARIHEREKAGDWKKPRFYILVTNAPISSVERKKCREVLTSSLSTAQVVIWGADDVCDRLDDQPRVRRAFPQLLSLRDLDELIDLVVSRESRERSLSAIENARDIIPVFVPTNAYNKCLNVLKKQCFAVLEGPPEVGKTSIAWVIAILQLAENWDAIACDKPGDFFGQYKSEAKQVFIADDAFGRTEYDPTLGKQWERQLDRVLRRIDSKHWLIWTSRKHILERAKRTMDLQGKAYKFPQPGDVLVDASNLTIKEKALMLYRHTQKAGLDIYSKDIIKKYASRIVRDPSFTPERVRRFVNETLPLLTDENKNGENFRQKLDIEISRAIQKPTERMKKSFLALNEPQKKLLISLLDSDDSDSSLVSLYNQRIKNTDPRLPFEDVLEEMGESFVKVILHEE